MAEIVFGTRRWVVLWLAGALAGHLVGEAWQPYSSGISVAFCGPLGGLAVWAVVCRARSPDPAPPPMMVLPVLVVGSGVLLTVFRDIHGPAILAGAVAAVPAVRRHRA